MKKILLLIFLIFIGNISQAEDKITIGSKKFSESIILSEMLSILLEEKYNIPVERKMGFGGTSITLDALKAGDIDVYPDYTGTGYIMILKLSGEKDKDKVYDIVKAEFFERWNIVWSKPIGFNNTYALAVKKDDPVFEGIENISDLEGKLDDVRYAAGHEFMERADGHESFVNTYNLDFNSGNVFSMEVGLIYSAIRDDQVDMIVAYSTDGRIDAYDLRLLNDDLGFFPYYYAAFLSRSDTLEKYPELGEAIKLLEGTINEPEMVKMNDAVDRLKESPYHVAKNFLIERDLIEGEVLVSQGGVGFFGYLMQRRDYLLKLLYEHLLISLGALGFALIVSIPTGILLTRYPLLGNVVFPVINTLQTIPSLALLGFLVPIMGIGVAPAIVALFLYSLLPLVRNTYAGMLSVDKSFIEVSKGIGLTGMQVLLKVEIPMALPVIIAGLRTAAVIVIGTATLAALIGAGGFGDPIFRGISTVDSRLILLGAIPAALLAVVFDKIIGFLEKSVVSKGLVLQSKR